jgi:hypothetical protein
VGGVAGCVVAKSPSSRSRNLSPRELGPNWERGFWRGRGDLPEGPAVEREGSGGVVLSQVLSFSPLLPRLLMMISSQVFSRSVHTVPAPSPRHGVRQGPLFTSFSQPVMVCDPTATASKRLANHSDSDQWAFREAASVALGRDGLLSSGCTWLDSTFFFLPRQTLSTFTAVCVDHLSLSAAQPSAAPRRHGHAFARRCR